MARKTRYSRNQDGKKTLKKYHTKTTGTPKVVFKKYNQYYNKIKNNDWYRAKFTHFRDFSNYDPTFSGTFKDGDFEYIDSIAKDKDIKPLQKLKIFMDFLKPLADNLDISDYHKQCLLDRLEINTLYDIINFNYYWFAFNGFKRFYLYSKTYENLTLHESLKNERYFNLRKTIEERQGIMKSNTLDTFDLFSPLSQALYNKVRNGTILEVFFVYVYLHNTKKATLPLENKQINKFLLVLSKYPEFKEEYNTFSSTMDNIYSICFKEFLEYARDFL